MKIYILTCINEASELVSCKAYKTLQLAASDMICSVMAEYSEFKKVGRRGIYTDIRDTSAAVGDEECCYIYDITEDEI